MRRIKNPPNPYDRFSAEYVGEPPPVKLEVFEETATKKIITKAFASDWEGGWRYTVNCYRGCIHGCTYCFARQYHEYLGYGAGTDFETKIVVKPNAPQLLREELKKTREKMPHLDFSFATDPYLPLEAEYRLTRQCLEVCADFQIPVGIITKSPLITRDIEILKRFNKISVFFSLPFLTKERSNPFEPYTPIPEARFRAMKMLSDEGIKTGIGIAPVILGYNESDIPGLLERAKESGAQRAFMSLLHLDTDSIEEYFVAKMSERLPPTRVTKITNTIKRERGGKLRHSSYAERSVGKTEQWEITRNLFEFHARRLGFNQPDRPEVSDLTVGPNITQQSLF
ncbi:radical SAM protein [Leptolyngbya sp. 7M]|uniref:radical SAM protein n=1 Tax=Leptolyngbya sp. 7M TaxID=2812896 RepID=UPI001B8D14F3|nr:radical SAM protein [Leptolyngbya sp. 7M]QYO66392.1 radical SAM protein [Leptolyngbya sp. 7M]